MIISFHKNFIKDFKKHSPKIKTKFQERLMLFEKDEDDPKLNNHELKGAWINYRSINVTGDIRAVFKKVANNEVIFVAIDSHSKLYG